LEKLELDIDDLLLDVDNPRIGEAASQTEALAAIVNLDSRHFKTMMESIRDHGLDPGDAFYIIEEEGFEDYVVVDGNRRLAALKVLHEPNLLHGIEITDTIRNRLAKVTGGFDRKSVETVNCVLFDDRATADDWILRRHGRGTEGEARIPWGTLEIQRFQKDQTVLDVIDFVAKNSTFTDHKWATIKSEVENKPSIVKRFVESKPLKKLLGLSVREEDGQRLPSFTIEPEAALPACPTAPMSNRTPAAPRSPGSFC
jgi:hypothetical protein